MAAEITGIELREMCRTHKLVEDVVVTGLVANFHFEGVTFKGVHFKADLQDCIFSNCTFKNASFSGVTIGSVMMRHSTMEETRFYNCFIIHCVFNWMDLSNTSFHSVSLTYSVIMYNMFRNTEWREGFVDEKKNTFRDNEVCGLHGDVIDFAFVPMACPEKGKYMGYIKRPNGVVWMVEVPKKAKRVSGNSSKCRASEVKILCEIDARGKVSKKRGRIQADYFDVDRWNDAGAGIVHYIEQ